MAWDVTERPNSVDLEFDTEAVQPEKIAQTILATIRQQRNIG